MHKNNRKPYVLTMYEAMEKVCAAEERYQKRHAEQGREQWNV